MAVLRAYVLVGCLSAVACGAGLSPADFRQRPVVTETTLLLDAGLGIGGESTWFDGEEFTPLLPYLDVPAGATPEDIARASQAGLGVAIMGTVFDELYQTEVWVRAPSAAFIFPVEDGDYTVHLHFVDWHPTDTSGPGDRVFHVDINGYRACASLDIIAEAGKLKALVKSHDLVVTGGKLTIALTNVVFYAEIAAVEIVPRGRPHLPLEE